MAKRELHFDNEVPTCWEYSMPDDCSRDSEHLSATVLYADGSSARMNLPEEIGARLRQVQKMVGGRLEVVPIAGRRYLVVSESAKDAQHGINRSATKMARETESIPPGDYLAGVVVLVSQQALE